MTKLTRLTQERKDRLIKMGQKLEKEKIIVEQLRQAVAVHDEDPSPQAAEIVEIFKRRLFNIKQENRRYFTKNILI